MTGRATEAKALNALWPALPAVLLGAALLLWPALYNRYPLVLPDSVAYALTGRSVIRDFFHPERLSQWTRSEIFSVSMTAVDFGRSYWPFILANALGASAMLWLVLRCLLRRRRTGLFLFVVVALSALTPLSWIVCLPMTDVWGPFVYMAIFLLVFCRAQLMRWERHTLAAFIVWGASAHTAHAMIAWLLLTVLCIVWALRASWMRGRGRELLLVGVLLAASALSLMVVHWHLYGKPSIGGRMHPIIAARLIADGTGRRYLLEHCNSHPDWVLCRDPASLPSDDQEFLWGEKGVWLHADPETRDKLRAEEGPFARATIASYLADQLRASARDSWNELRASDVSFLSAQSFVNQLTDSAIPGSLPGYLNSRLAQGTLALPCWSRIQAVALVAAWVALAAVLPFAWRARRRRFLLLAALMLMVCVTNAVICGSLSTQDARYEARVIWLVLFLAILGWTELWDARVEPSASIADL